MSLFKKDSSTQKYASLEDEMLSQVQAGIRSIAGNDSELSNKTTEEIRDYFETFVVALDLHLETIKEISKELKIKWSSQEKLDRIRGSILFSRIVANEPVLLEDIQISLEQEQHDFTTRIKVVEIAIGSGLSRREGFDMIYVTLKNSIDFALSSHFKEKDAEISSYI